MHMPPAAPVCPAHKKRLPGLSRLEKSDSLDLFAIPGNQGKRRKKAHLFKPSSGAYSLLSPARMKSILPRATSVLAT